MGLWPRVLMVTILAAGCASKTDFTALEGRVQSTERGNTVQNQRLSDLERGTTAALEQQAKESTTRLEREISALRDNFAVRLESESAALRQELSQLRESMRDNADLIRREIKGTRENARKEIDRLDTEQKRQIERLERNQAQITMVNRRFDEQVKDFAANREDQKELADELNLVLTRQLAEMHATQTRLSAVEVQLKSPIGDIPAKTKADRAFREAFALMVDAQLDLAADRFRAFREDFPDDERVVEALYREGQCYYLLRKHDHALVPSFELVDRHAGHPRVEEARWIVARSLEETGDFKLARQFFAEMIENNSRYKADAIRRVQFINQLQPASSNPPGR